MAGQARAEAGIDIHRLTSAIVADCLYHEVTPAQRRAGKTINFMHLYHPEGRFMVTADSIERRMTREEIVEILEGRYSIQCYDHESKRELAEALAEAANTEGDAL
jgi:DNA polymerase I-like protein with 3'-5' exonuclease and polymerase domains